MIPLITPPLYSYTTEPVNICLFAIVKTVIRDCLLNTNLYHCFMFFTSSFANLTVPLYSLQFSPLFSHSLCFSLFLFIFILVSRILFICLVYRSLFCVKAIPLTLLSVLQYRLHFEIISYFFIANSVHFSYLSHA